MHNIRSHSRFLQELLVICPGEGVAPFKLLYVFKQTLVRHWASCDTTRIKLGFGGGDAGFLEFTIFLQLTWSAHNPGSASGDTYWVP